MNTIDLRTLPPAPPLLRMEADHHSGVGGIQLLRDKALALASANLLDAALPLFLMVAVLDPRDAQSYSDLGVTWMRKGAWEQAWASFGRALAM